MPNNHKSSTTSTTSTTTAASKKIPRPGNNTVYSIQVLTTTAITKSKAKSKVADETPPPKVPKRTLGGRKLGGFVPTEAVLDSVGDPMNLHPIEIEDEKIDELRQIELEIPKLWLLPLQVFLTWQGRASILQV